MSGHDVAAPDGTKWHVRRRVAPRLGQHTLWSRVRSRYKKMVRGTGDAAGHGDSGCIPDAADELIFALVAVAVLLLLVFVIVPFIAVLIDVLILAVLTFLGILARVVFRRPWTVEASSDNGITFKTKVVGWRASGEECAAMAQRLGAGMDPLVRGRHGEILPLRPSKPSGAASLGD